MWRHRLDTEDNEEGEETVSQTRSVRTFLSHTDESHLARSVLALTSQAAFTGGGQKMAATSGLVFIPLRAKRVGGSRGLGEVTR